jgi:hypothetical protein
MLIGNPKIPLLNLGTKEDLIPNGLVTKDLPLKVASPQLNSLANFRMIPQLKHIRLIMIDVEGIVKITVVV